MLCLSSNIKYAIEYAQQDKKHFGRLYAVHLSRDLDLLNLWYPPDWKKLSQKVPEKKLELLKTDDWLNYTGPTTAENIFAHIKERDHLIQIVMDLGYEGFFNYETVKHDPSIALFDNTAVKIIRSFQDDELLNYIEKAREEGRLMEQIKKEIFDPAIPHWIRDCLKIRYAGKV